MGAAQHPKCGVPLILDQAKTPEQKQRSRSRVGPIGIGRPFFMPPNVPAERVTPSAARSTQR